MIDMHYDLDQIYSKLEVHLHQLAMTIEVSGNDDEETAELFVAIEEMLKVLPAIVLGNCCEIVYPGIDEEDEAIKLKACVIDDSLIADLLKC